MILARSEVLDSQISQVVNENTQNWPAFEAVKTPEIGQLFERRKHAMLKSF